MQSMSTPRALSTPAFDTVSFPREALELICHFLDASDVARLARVDRFTYEGLQANIPVIGVAGIAAALARGEADEAARKLSSFCRWLDSASEVLTLDALLRTWQSLQDLASHATFQQEQRDKAFARVFSSAYKKIDAAEEVLPLLVRIRESWQSAAPGSGSLIGGAFCFAIGERNHGQYVPTDLELRCGASILAAKCSEDSTQAGHAWIRALEIATQGPQPLHPQFRLFLYKDLSASLHCVPEELAPDLIRLLDQCLAPH
jgi:hypothetical protein